MNSAMEVFDNILSYVDNFNISQDDKDRKILKLLHEAFEYEYELIGSYKVILINNNFGTSLPNDVCNRAFGKAYISNLFCGDKAFYLDSSIVKSHLQFKKSHFYTDYSVSLDSNFISYLVPYLKGKKQNAEIKNTIKDIAKQKIQFDPMPYLLENSIRLDDSNHLYSVYENLFFYEIFRTDSNPSENTLDNLSELEKNQIKLACDGYLHSLNKMDEFIKMTKNVYRGICCFLAEIIFIQHTYKNKSISFKMEKILSYCNNDLGVILERELVVALNYFQGNLKRFFKDIQPTKDNWAKVIKNMAWDLCHIRYLEFSRILNNKKDFGADFTVNALLTFDRGLIEVLKTYQIKIIFYSEEAIYPNILYDNPLSKRLMKLDVQLGNRLLELFEIPQIQSRRIAQQNWDSANAWKVALKKIEDVKNSYC